MPPLARLRVTALADLADQLRHASRAALVLNIERAEALVGEIKPEGAYEEDWIIERVTAMRPDLDHPATLVGQAVLADLSAFVERLSAQAALTIDEVGDGAVGSDELAARWGVSRKTVDRYRRLGLIARRVLVGPGRSVLVFGSGAVDAFERAHAERLARAARFSRIEPATAAKIIAASRPLRDAGATMNQAARELAKRFGRSHEAVRQLLTRHDANADEPIFSGRGPLTEHQRALAWRAVRRGIEPAELARRWQRSPASVRRGINIERARRLGGLDLTGPAGAWFAQPDARAKALDPEPVQEGLGEPGATDLVELIARARAARAPIGAVVRSRAIAACYLRWRACQQIGELSRASPEAGLLDRIETDLRWAARLIAELVRAHLGSLTRTLEGRLDTPLDVMRSGSLRPLIEHSLKAMAAGVWAFDPFGPGRLAARLVLEIDRAAQRWLADHPEQGASSRAGRASARLMAGVAIADWTRRVAPWQAWLEPDPRVRAVLDHLDPIDREVLVRRLGFGTKPWALDELAIELGVARIALPRIQRQAYRKALSRVRR